MPMPARFLERTSPPNIATLILLAGIAALAMNVFLPSLPNMTEYFDTEYRIMQLSVALYLGVNAVVQLIIGPFSDRWGRRPVVLWGLVIFVLASIGCVFSTNIWVFLFFRMLQSTVVAAMVLSRAVVRDMVPQEQAASMIAYVTMGVAVIPMVAPFVGGHLEEWFGWQSNFWLLAVLGALVLWMSWADLGETAALSGRSLMQQFREYPQLLTSPRFWGYSMATALSSGAFFAYIGGAPFVGNHVFGLTPSELGSYFGVPAVGYFLGNFISGRYSTRVGINRMIFIGCIINTLGITLNLLFHYSDMATPFSFFGLMVLVGLGNGMVIPNGTSGSLSVRSNLAGTASGLAGALMIGGGAILSAIAGLMLKPGTGAFPLLWLMLATALLSIIAIIVVISRERQIVYAE